ncbi:MAG: chromate transporter [Treponema sp.]|nr:chromate transporter [Treponema sp.]
MTNSYTLLQLFFIFFYVGLFTIGGGLVAITLMQQMLVEKGVITATQFYNMVAISESTPGPIGINMATYIGYSQYGVLGGIVTTMGQVLPSIICIVIIAHFFMKMHDKPIVKSAFSILRPATTGIIMVAAFQVFCVALIRSPESFSELLKLVTWKNLFVWQSLAFYVLALLILLKTKLHPVFVIALGALFGILFL